MMLGLMAFCWTSALLLAQPNMRLIKGGTYRMGADKGDADEKPSHWVVVGGFWVSTKETTYADFKTFIEASGYLTDAERGEGSYVWDSLGWHLRSGVNWRHDERGHPREQMGRTNGLFPVLHVSWNDAAQYCNWLSDRDSFDKVYDFQGDTLRIDVSATGYRLPTEAEWEYAASGGASSTEMAYYSPGSLKSIAWYSANSTHGPRPVALKRSNAFGLFDMTGNVWEWCHDWYSSDYYTKSREAVDPAGPLRGKERSVRGGAWNNNATHCRTTNRSSRFPDFRDGSIGFRVLRRDKF